MNWPNSRRRFRTCGRSLTAAKRYPDRRAGERLPPELLNRPKMGFGVPLSDWFRGELRAFLWDHLTSASSWMRDRVARLPARDADGSTIPVEGITVTGFSRC